MAMSFDPSSRFKVRKKHRSFGGTVEYCSFSSDTCKTIMNFSIFVPSPLLAAKGGNQTADRMPAIIWLSGLTCTEENFMAKSGAQRVAAELGLILICPDTSPRDTGTPGENDSYDLGTGAGFYIDATQKPWSTNYQMASFVSSELTEVIATQYPVDSDKISIMGHSMGGHGALVLALKNPKAFLSVSAFAPICAPSKCPWGKKAFQAYFGSELSLWEQNDASTLIRKGTKPEFKILVDQGLEDEFLSEQLLLEELEGACKATKTDLICRRHEGYDHSYYFIASFIEDHLRFHAENLRR